MVIDHIEGYFVIVFIIFQTETLVQGQYLYYSFVFLMVVRWLPWCQTSSPHSIEEIEWESRAVTCTYVQKNKHFQKHWKDSWCHRATSIGKEDWESEVLPISAPVVEADERKRDECWVSQSPMSVIMNFIKVFVSWGLCQISLNEPWKQQKYQVAKQRRRTLESDSPNFMPWLSHLLRGMALEKSLFLLEPIISSLIINNTMSYG